MGDLWSTSFPGDPARPDPELRQKPTVRAGIVRDHLDRDEISRVVIYEPGNGSRYALHLCEIRLPPKTLRDDMGWPATGDVVVVSDLLHGAAFTLSTDLQELDPERVSAGLQRSFADGVVLAELIVWTRVVSSRRHCNSCSAQLTQDERYISDGIEPLCEACWP